MIWDRAGLFTFRALLKLPRQLMHVTFFSVATTRPVRYLVSKIDGHTNCNHTGNSRSLQIHPPLSNQSSPGADLHFLPMPSHGLGARHRCWFGHISSWSPLKHSFAHSEEWCAGVFDHMYAASSMHSRYPTTCASPRHVAGFGEGVDSKLARLHLTSNACEDVVGVSTTFVIPGTCKIGQTSSCHLFRHFLSPLGCTWLDV